MATHLMTTARRVALGLVCVGAASVAAACGGFDASGSDEGGLTYAGYGSAFQENQAKAWQEPFTAQGGASFTNDSPADMAKVRAMVQAGNPTWDVVDSSSSFATSLCGEALERIDPDVVPRDRFVDGQASDCGVPNQRFGLVFVYNTEAFGDDPPTSIRDFFDREKYPGKRIIPRELTNGSLENALVADGVDREDLYPLDLDRALRVMDRIKSDTTFTTTNGQAQQLIVSGQAKMGLMVSARAITSLKAGAPLKGVFDATPVTWNTFMIPKGSPNKAEAEKFIEFATRPEQSAKFAELSGTVPANPSAKPRYDAETKELDAFGPGREDGTFDVDMPWWAKNQDGIEERFTAWLGG